MFLRQSTAQAIRFGPFLDAGDGVTEEVSLTITPALMQLSQDGAGFAATSGVSNAVHDKDGWYSVTLTTADTDTVGELILMVQTPATHLPVWKTFWVIEEAVYDAIYGAAAEGPLQGTTAGNKLDVNATGEAGLDLDNTSGAIAAAQLGADCITNVKVAPSVHAEAADAVWDEALTGATHAVADSAGRRLRDLQEFGIYEGGAVWIDTVNGTAGTTDYESGTVFNPVNTIADANTLAASLGLSRFRIAPGSSITFAATQANQSFIGHEWTLALGGQNIAGTEIVGATISGTGTGAGYVLESCSVGAVTLANGDLRGCGLSGAFTASAASDYFFDGCYSHIAGGGSWTFDFGAAVVNTNLSLRHHSGGVTINNKDNTGTDLMSIEGHGQLVVAASSSGAISLRGGWEVTNTGGATITYDDLSQNAIDTLPRKNAALSNIPVMMVLASDHVTPATGLTVTGERSIDGAAFVGVSGSIAEISDGIYQFDAVAADMNGDFIAFRFSSGTADDTFAYFRTAGS